MVLGPIDGLWELFFFQARFSKFAEKATTQISEIDEFFSRFRHDRGRNGTNRATDRGKIRIGGSRVRSGGSGGLFRPPGAKKKSRAYFLANFYLYISLGIPIGPLKAL